MKKVASFIFLFILISMSTMIYAATGVEAYITSTSNNLQVGDTVTFTLKFDNFKDVNHGINAYKATLVYDEDIFEEVKDTNFKSLNDWEGLKYNKETGEFVAYKKAGTTTGEDVAQISFKVKENAKAAKTEVKVVNVETSEGKKDIEVVANNTKQDVNIVEEQQPGDITNPGGVDDTNNETQNGNTNENKQDSIYNKKLPNAGLNSFGLFLLLGVEIVLVVTAIYFGRKYVKSNKIKMYAMILAVTLLSTQFIGTTYGAIVNFAKKGEINGDGNIDYADVSLLVSHLANIKHLDEGKTEDEALDVLERADMNSDSKITITDLSVLIQKLEDRLNYKVEILDLTSSNNYPQKNENITLSFDYNVNYDATIKTITINGQEYEVIKNEQDNNYNVEINVGSTSGVKEYKIESAKLNNGKVIKTESSINVDVLKQSLQVKDYKVEQDIENVSLDVSFNVEDIDNAFLKGTYNIIETNITNVEDLENEENTENKESIQSGEVKAGNNNIKVKVEEGKNYKLALHLEYKLSSGDSEEDMKYSGYIDLAEILSFNPEYNFELSNIKTYKSTEQGINETNEFDIGDEITLKFNSTNSTPCVPKEAVINGIKYPVEREGNIYTVDVDAFDSNGKHEIVIEQIILNNGKTFDLENQKVEIKIIKKSPTIGKIRTDEDTNTKILNLKVHLRDEDKTASKLVAKLYDEKGNEISSVDLTSQLVDDNLIEENSMKFYDINANLDVSSVNLSNKYKIKLMANYNLLEDDQNYIFTDKVIYENDIEAKAVVNIKDVQVSNEYPEKNEDITLTYKIETNKNDVNISRITINNLRCIATKHVDNDDNVTYSVTLPVGQEAGIIDLHATEFIFEKENMIAYVDNTVKVDVLKDKPTSEKFLQVDNINDRSVTLTANIVDPDGAFINGTATLVSCSDNAEVETCEFDAEHVTFTIGNLELEKEYNLIAKMTYDRDSQVGGQNYVENVTFRERPIQLIADYKLSVSDLKTFNEDIETKYFERGHEVTLTFNSTNKTAFYPVKAIINDKEYQLEKQGNEYKTKISVVSEAGPKTITIQKLILDNTKEIEVTENNKINVGILKLRPKISDFGFEEGENNTINVSFAVNDTENAITGGTTIITDENGTKIKEEPFTKDTTSISFTKNVCEEYEIKVLANYDLDSNTITQDENEYYDQVLLSETINISSNRLFEIKDITNMTVYEKTAEGKVVEVSRITEDDLTDLSKYLVKVQTKGMPTFYANVLDTEISSDNKLNFILDYKDVIQYEDGKKHSQLKVTYSEMKNGVAENKSIESLIQEIEANPTGTFELTQDYDAANMKSSGNTVISVDFAGTLNGNGHKIHNLKKPLFNNLVDNANVTNLILEDVELVGANSRGSIANTAENTTISNVHVKGLSMTTAANECGGIVGELKSNCTVEQSSVTKLNIKLSHIRIAGIAGKLAGSTIKNCYVEGVIESIISTKDGVGGIAGDSQATPQSKIENCISKVSFVNNTRASNNGGILGLARSANTILTNNISLNTGTGLNHVFGSLVHSTSSNNYELEESELISNVNDKNKNLVKRVSKANINKEFFINSANFSEDIWEFDGTSYDKLPHLKNSDPNVDTEDVVEKPENDELYIPEYERVSKISGFDKTKAILYNNLHKLMPYYDAKYLVMDGAKFASDNVLNTKVIKHILPFAENKLVNYLTSNKYDNINKIKVVFDDHTIEEYNVSFDKFKQNVAIYKIDELNINYAYNNYVIKEDAALVNTIAEYIEKLDYATILDPLTTAADDRQYRDNYITNTKTKAREIALKILQNDEDSTLMLDNEILSTKVEQELMQNDKLNKMLYAYNYYLRWYGFEIGGANVSDIMLFNGKMYSDTMTFYNVVREVFVGNMTPGNTADFYNVCLKKYTGSSTLGYFLDYIISNVGDYDDVNDWFTEYFGARNVLYEISADNKPEILYRGWFQLKKNHRMILPVITMPVDSTYMISGPAHLQFGPQQLYHKNPSSTEGKTAILNAVKNHCILAKRHFSTLAGSFDTVNNWNNYCIMVYDCTKAITGYRQSYITINGIKIPTGKIVPIYTAQGRGTNQPFCKNFSEVLNLWQPAGNSAGVGNTAGFLWFQATPGLNYFDTWTHEFEHALYDKIMLNKRGLRFRLETLTQGNVEQRESWSLNNLNQDVGPYYFNTSFYLNKESNATQNLTPDRINTREKLENYFKGQQNALDLLDYIEGKAFIKLTPEQQARIATRMSISPGWSSWGTITAAQAEQMKLNSLESLYDNQIMLRPNDAWGASVRGLTVINGIGADDYGYESVWVNRWFIGHYDNGYADSFSIKRNFFEMLGYAGVDGYVAYGSRVSSSDLDAIRKITKAVTGTEMDWKQYKMSRYATVEESLENNKYIDFQYMIDRFTEALTNDANNGNRNLPQRTNLRKIYYHYLKSATNDFVDDPLGTTVEVNHIKTAEELVEKINAKPYGYYVLDNDIDFSGMTKNVTQTFMGRLDGNGHKIIGNKIPIFNKIRYGYVGNIVMENTDIPRNITNAGALAYKIECSTAEKISATGLQIYFGSKNDLSLIGGAISNTIARDCTVERLVTKISNKDEFVEKINNEKSGLFELTADIDFSGYTTTTSSVITDIFVGKIQGNGHKISNLNNLSLFASFRGTFENATIENFTNTSSGKGSGDFVTAFAHDTYTSTVKNVTFKDITLSGRNNVAVLSGMDGRENANSIFENIKVLNSNVTGTGVYVSNLVGRKYGGSIKNVYVQGILNVTGTENGGVVGTIQQGGAGTYENIISDVDVNKPNNTFSNIDNSKYNASLIGVIYTNPVVKNCVSFGNMTGYTDTSGNEILPYKFTGTIESTVTSCLTKCYEITELKGASRVTANTAGHLDTIARASLNADFYRDLGFSEELWDFTTIASKGHPVLK